MDTKALRQKILGLAIRGKLVPQDPNDEPASVLLERIRAEKQQMVKDGKLKPKDIKNDTIIFVGEDNLHYEKFQDGSVKCIEDEIPFDVPEGWEWCRLTEITFEIFAGGDKPENYSKTQTDEFSIPIFANGAENDGLYGFTNKARVNKSAITVSARGTIGFCCIRHMPFVPIVRLITIVPAEGINIEYLRIVFQALIETGEGSSIPQLTVPGIKPKLIPIPPYSEQTRISNKLIETEKIVSAVELNQESVVNYIKLAKAKILDLAIRGQLVPQDPNDEPALVLLERIRAEKEELIKAGKIKRDKKESIIFRGEDNSYYEKIGSTIKNIDDSIPFEIPGNWCFIRLKELWKLISGRDLSPSEYNDNQDGIPYITGASNFRNGTIELVRWTSSPQVITKQGDLLLTCKGTVGELAFNDFGNAHIARQIMAIRNTYGLNVEYLSFCISFYIEEIKAVAKGLIPGISREDILNLILPIPPENYQRLVVSQIRRSNHALYLIEKSLI
ncbi:MAG: restriction endonuclease subunit S [Lactobacillus rogosae]